MRLAFAILGGVVRRLACGARWMLLFGLILLVVRRSVLPVGLPYTQLALKVHEVHFDYIGWELQAIGAKVAVWLGGGAGWVDEPARSAFVRAYFDDLARVQSLEAQIDAAYTNPAEPDPARQTESIRAERDALRADLQARQSWAEAILEGQVSAVLIEQGFGVGGQLIPPMAMRFSQPTMVLITSPRDRIHMEHVLTLDAVPTDERERLETDIQDTQNLSAIVSPIGGMALYPAMIIESANLPYIVETFAHEWLHHYLMLHPLGWETEFFLNPEARIINETSASIFGREIAALVLARYYADLAPPAAPTAPNTSVPTEPPAFDFDAEMHATRVQVDTLLAAGHIYEAEAYMEQRRRLFYENGYRIRKLNQAWFAFYGGYQVEGISAGGTDPTGEALRVLRTQAPSLREWVRTVQALVTREQLLSAAGMAR